MKDLIERQAAIDALQEEIVKWTLPDDTAKAVRCGVRSAKNIVEDLPSVQPDIAQLLAYECGKASAQPEIVQCKKCKWYEGDVMANPWGVCCHDGWTSGNIGHEVSENGWCYRAERKTE